MPARNPAKIGDRFGSWTIVGYDPTGPNGCRWISTCDCGQTTALRNVHGMRKHPTCQRCQPMRKRAGLEGQTFGSLTVLRRLRMTRSGALWLCECECGNEVEKITSTLCSGANVGCKACEPTRRALVHVTHGGALGGCSRLYNIWKGMLQRCRDTENPHYGAKGITVCRQWQDFSTFRAWAMDNGYAPTLSIDRMDPTLGYWPANCEWVTRAENSRRVFDPKIKRAA
jgi:hypothetical protein